MAGVGAGRREHRGARTGVPGVLRADREVIPVLVRTGQRDQARWTVQARGCSATRPARGPCRRGRGPGRDAMAVPDAMAGSGARGWTCWGLEDVGC